MEDFDYDFEKAYDYIISVANEYGIKITEGTGQFLKDGKPFDFADVIPKVFPTRR